MTAVSPGSMVSSRPAINDGHVYHQYTVRVEGGRRDAMKEHLAGSGIDSAVYYPYPLHLMRLFSASAAVFPLDRAEAAAREVLSLPVEPLMSDEEAGAVVKAVMDFMFKPITPGERGEPMKNFALIGAAGYVAPRHMRAIRETGNNLVASLDKHDAVGVMDSYFPASDFFVEFERFDRHIEKLKRLGPEKRVDYVSIASPNYLHDAHIRFALRVGADAVCEKPMVLNPWNVDALKEIEADRATG